MLVGEPDDVKNGDEAVKTRASVCGSVAMKTWEILKAHKKGEDTVALFKDTPIKESIEMSREYETLRRVALGYGTYGTVCYHNEELLSDLLWALDWCYRHYYGKAEMENKGWRDIRAFNWHDWKIASPRALMDVMLIVDEHLTLEQKRDYLALFNMLVKVPTDYAANKVNFGRLIVQSGLLTEREELITCGRDGIENTYLYADGNVNDGQGFYRDGSYIFHTRHSQNACYGLEHLNAAIKLTTVLDGSEFAVKKEYKDILYTWLYNNFLPFYRNGEIVSAVCGRYPENSKANTFLGTIVRLYAISDKEWKGKLSALLRKVIEQHPQFVGGECADFFGTLTISEYLSYRELMNEPKSEEEIDLCGFRAFNQMDRVVCHEENQAFVLAMSSSRIYNYECINFRNMKGWYHGDGMLYCYDSGLDYDAEYWAGVDHYRMPGTTADNRERAEVSIAQANEYLSSKDFVGGLATGDTGVAVMQLESYHSDGQLISTRFYNPSGAYGSAPPAHTSTLVAKKAYFFLGGYAVCLGSEINSKDGAPVYTVVDNRKDEYIFENGKAVGHAERKVTVNGESVTLSAIDTEFSDVEYVTNGRIAYCLPKKHTLTLKRTDGTPAFNEIIWQHGVNPENESYAYAVLPNADADKAKAFCDVLPFSILENSGDAQIVRDNATGDTYYVIHNAGEYFGLSVEAPLLVGVKGGMIYACDVTQKLGKLTLKYNGKAYSFDFTGLMGKEISAKI